MQKMVLGSTSPHKRRALEEACRQLGITLTVASIQTRSGQNEQPVGWDETYAGAQARATQAQHHDPHAIAIGIESGIFRFGEPLVTLDLAVIVVLTPDGRQLVASSPGIAFPEECVALAQAQGFDQTTVGSIVAEMHGGDPTDPHHTLTVGKVSREQTLAIGLIAALAEL